MTQEQAGVQGSRVPQLQATPAGLRALCTRDWVQQSWLRTQSTLPWKPAEWLLVTQRQQCLRDTGRGNHKGLYFPSQPKVLKKKNSGSWSLHLPRPSCSPSTCRARYSQLRAVRVPTSTQPGPGFMGCWPADPGIKRLFSHRKQPSSQTPFLRGTDVERELSTSLHPTPRRSQLTPWSSARSVLREDGPEPRGLSSLGWQL